MSVEYEVQGSIAVLTLNDEARRNAMSTPLVTEALKLLEESRDDGTRAVVVRGAGPVFCAGADIRDMIETGWLELDKAKPDQKTPLDLFQTIEEDPRPVICAVEGLALGGGVELAATCDLAVAAEGAVFMLPELGLGALPNTALVRLPALIGWRNTLDLVLTRRKVTAAEARDLGFVNRLVGDGEALDAAVELALSIIKGAPPAVIAAAKGARPGQDWAAVNALLSGMDREEWMEGMSAFLEKRTPDYERFWKRS